MAQEALQAREGPRDGKPLAPLDLSEPASDRGSEEDPDILFTAQPRGPEGFVTPPRRTPEVTDYDIVNMVRTLNGAIAAVSQDTARIQRSYRQLCAENLARDKALADLTTMVKEYGSSPEATRPYDRSPGTTCIRPTMQADVMDGEGNLRAADIGIAWEGGETFLHAVKVVGSPLTTSRFQTDYVHTLPTGGRHRPTGRAYDGSTGHLEDTGSRRLCSLSLPGSTPGIPTGRADTKVQQQIS